MQRTNSRPLLLLTYSTVWQTATVCTNGTFGFESFIVIKKKKGGFHNVGRVSSSVLHSSWSLKTTQHPTNVNFKKKEIHWPWTLRGHFKVKAWSSAWSVVRALRMRRSESGISVLWLLRCKKFWAVWRFTCSSRGSLWGQRSQRDVRPCVTSTQNVHRAGACRWKQLHEGNKNQLSLKVPLEDTETALKRWKEASSNESVNQYRRHFGLNFSAVRIFFCTKLELCTNAGVISLTEGWMETVVKAFFFILAHPDAKHRGESYAGYAHLAFGVSMRWSLLLTLVQLIVAWWWYAVSGEVTTSCCATERRLELPGSFVHAASIPFNSTLFIQRHVTLRIVSRRVRVFHVDVGVWGRITRPPHSSSVSLSAASPLIIRVLVGLISMKSSNNRITAFPSPKSVLLTSSSALLLPLKPPESERPQIPPLPYSHPMTFNSGLIHLKFSRVVGAFNVA